MKGKPQTKRSWREVDLSALRHNFTQITSRAGGARVCAVIKANAYGHGAARLAPLYERWGASALALATLAEALELRASGVKLPLLVLGYTPPEEVKTLAQAGISQAVFSPEYARALSFSAAASGVRVKVHVKHDSGMGRLGFPIGQDPKQAQKALLTAARLPFLCVEGLFTHFACADEAAGSAYTHAQLLRFLSVRDALRTAGLFPLCHTANSAATLSYPKTHLDMVRPGLALFGIDPRDEKMQAAAPAALHPALSLKATVAQVKSLPRGASVGYGRTFTAPRKMRVATLTVGYADGLSRRHAETGGGVVATSPTGKEVFLPFVGRISMDQAGVDATAAPFLSAGDSVSVFGGSGAVSFAAAAARVGTIAYELMTALSPRAEIFYSNGE